MSSSKTGRTRSKRLPGVLVVEDSTLMRELVTDLIDGSGAFRVIGQARTGYEAIRLVHELDPDLVTLDLEMPDLGGLDTLGYIMSEAPRPVVILSAHGRAGAGMTLEALERGAVDFVLKPAGDSREGAAELRTQLIAALRVAARAELSNLTREPGGGGRRGASRRGRAGRRAELAECLVAIAASTGGPRALMELVPRLPAGLAAAVVVVQHMPARFTSMLAERLHVSSALPVDEAEDGAPVRGGRVYIAPGGRHLVLKRASGELVFALEDSEPVWGVRPAADVCFRAVAQTCGPRSLGVVLTGMGRDGTRGLRAIREVGGWTAVQDRPTSALFGMPRSAAPYARAVLPLERIASALAERVQELVRKRWA
ncbi:MAG: chemotaxis-specific protein-glutamate methyltransferase CheB [Gemmatimonadetes bacterium]|nr:chemotaxis-specific protein-glutamate methyltransferase CheB [Gemmatimonadota bacterium]